MFSNKKKKNKKYNVLLYYIKEGYNRVKNYMDMLALCYKGLFASDILQIRISVLYTVCTLFIKAIRKLKLLSVYFKIR